MRIVFLLASADLSGGSRVVATHARLLGRRGHRVTVVSVPSQASPLPSPVPPPKPQPPSLRQRVRALVWRREPRAEPVSHLAARGIDHRILDRFRPIEDRDVPDADVVVATWWTTAEWVAALAPRKGAKAHFIQGDDLATPGQPSDRVAATWRLPLYRIVCSRWLVDLAKNHYGVGSVPCVPNGVDTRLFTAPPRSRQRAPTIGLVYSGLAMKGSDLAFEAIAQASRSVPGLSVISFGAEPGPTGPSLPARFEYHLRPEQKRIPGLYASCDAWIWPSRREGFGLPLLEAMACRTPVIACPAGAAPEILAAGGGEILSAAEAPLIANAIERVCSLEESAWKRLSREARAVAMRHDWDRSVKKMEAALQTASGAQSEADGA